MSKARSRRRRPWAEALELRRLLSGLNTPPGIAKSVPDLSIQAEVPFQFDLRPSGAVVFGYDVGGRDIRVTDNYFASKVRFFDTWDDVTFANNSIISRETTRVVQFEVVPSSEALNSFAWDGNHYVSDSLTPFDVGNQAQTWDQWRADFGLDATGTLANQADVNRIDVRANRYESGRGHAVIYNWQQLDSVEIDLSTIVSSGASFDIYNVLDLSQPVVSGVYSGGTVAVPMVNVVAQPPLGHRPSAPLVVDKEFGTFLIRSETPPQAATGNEFYVSPDGSPSGDGSADAPWDLATALSHPTSVLPGDTISIRGGTYSGRVTSLLAGTQSAPIQVRAYPGEDVKIDLHQGTADQSKRLSIEGQYTHYQGLEILSSDPASRTTQIPGSFPSDLHRGDLNVLGDHIKLINLEIHDLNNGIGYWSRGEGGEVYGTIIYNNGWMGPDRNHGHAIYSQNEDTLRTFSDNITFNQFRNGIKIYGSDQASLKNYNLEGNVSFNNGGGAGEGFTGTFQFLIGGGSLAESITVEENFAYVGKHFFEDPDSGDNLTYSARQTDGQPLPGWLTFYGDEGFFVGSPAAEDAGMIEIEVTATDTSGASVTDVFELMVRPADGSDITPPEVSALDVQDESTDVAVNTELTVLFDEDIQLGAGNVLILRGSDGMAEQTIDIQSTNVSVSGAQLRINPPLDLDPMTDYSIQIYPGSVLDLAANPFAGISDMTSWNFVTAAPPQISSITINGGELQRSSVTQVTALFSSQVDIDFNGGDPFQFLNTTTGEVVVDTPVVSLHDDATMVQFTFAAGPSVGTGGSLLNGDYQLRIDASRIHAKGLSLDGDGDGSEGDDHVDSFYRKYGDLNANGIVDLLDFAMFRRTFGKSAADSAFNGAFDANGNDWIDLTDYAAFRRGFGS